MTEHRTGPEIERLNEQVSQLRRERDHVAYLLLAAEQQVARLLAMKESVPETPPPPPPPATPPAPTQPSRPKKPISTARRVKRRIKRALAAQ